ncbi:DEAD/DEAH box helicase [Zalerion maritima]|uniref:DEAD/DEAH box helicase n=1 Tax=Zalerion maritima TaxID=339359 RepID=A0AAD5WUL0_9PEZI|nr:DEAD/DEAH box helicase [Zalerion maritima]
MSSDELEEPSAKRRRVSPKLSTDSSSDSEVPAVKSLPSRIKRNKPVASSTKPTARASSQATLKAIGDSGDDNEQDDSTFGALGVKPGLVRALGNLAIKVPTPIQRGCIPAIMEGKDCIGRSRTGSGKTVAFAVPILQELSRDPSVIFGLVLTATRELALQIYEQFKAIASRQSLRISLVTGGFDMMRQAIELSHKPHIVIATPGRLADHIRSSGEDTVGALKRIKFLVMDEADRLLAEGPGSMLEDLGECLEALPPPDQRQTLLFTATMTSEVMSIRKKPTRPGKLPVHVCEIDDKTAIAVPPTLHQTYLLAPDTHKEHYLHEFLKTKRNEDQSTIVFVNRKKTADTLTRTLRMLGHRVTALHSAIPQRERVDNLGRFRASAARVLVATDVASRGLDIPEVKMIVNYDVPLDPDDYIHRVGRTARAGKSGESVTFFGRKADEEKIEAIEARVGCKMEPWEEEGVNIETRIKRDSLQLVSAKKREALLDAEEGRDVKGNKKRGKRKLNATP